MPKFDVLVDGEKQSRLDSAGAVTRWLVAYRAEHEEDDPDAVHVQVLEHGSFAWLTGGRLVDREQFLADGGLHAVDG